MKFYIHESDTRQLKSFSLEGISAFNCSVGFWNKVTKYQKRVGLYKKYMVTIKEIK